MAYTKHFSTKQTPQSEAIPGKQMKENNAGGFAFQIDKWSRLDRFLILGSEGGTYYVGEHKLTVENAQGVVECVKDDGPRAVNRIVEVSVAGRAPKNDPAIFALAIACTFGNAATKTAAYHAISGVCRIGTHIFQFCQCVQDLRGWSRGLRNGVGKFYDSKTPRILAHQLIKYQQREGWTHRDVMRLCHPKSVNHNLANYAVGKPFEYGELPLIVQGFETIKSLNLDLPGGVSEREAVKIINETGIPRECIPTQLLNSKEVWDALLRSGDGMPMTAMIRNLGKMTSVGLLGSAFDDAVKIVCAKLADADAIKKARVHPLAILTALKTYSLGHGIKGSLTWSPVAKIAEALNEAFYLAFGAVEPTNKNIVLGLDVSGSMSSGSVGGSPLTPREACAAMALITRRIEPSVEMLAFTSRVIPFEITGQEGLASVIRRMDQLDLGRTDCAAPMLHAQSKQWPVDAFIVYTDNETWCGNIHPSQALAQYRHSMSRPEAKSIVVGMTATEFSIADPADPGMLDVVGFDTAVPAVMSEFIGGAGDAREAD
jgi:60 kDa SS-A/Ro ribonucleoprotein